MHWVNTALDWSLSALAVYGYLIVFVATFAENLFIVGSFMPGDIVTAAAAFTATTEAGQNLSIWGLLAVAVAGTLLGMNVSYFIGRRGGRDLIARVGPRFGVTIESIEAGEEYFDRHGALTILFARFVAVLKNISPAIAGASRMRVVAFEAVALVASIGYAAILLSAGWFLGANFRAGLKFFGAFSWLLFVGVVIAVVLAWRGKRRHDRRLLAQSAAEFEAEHGRIACGPEAPDAEPCEESTDDDA